MSQHTFDHLTRLLQPNAAKIVFLVMDGLGGLPMEADGPTELEAAATPNLNRLAREGACGLHVPVGPGITPGSGPGHLSLFGYDPLEFVVGRGVLSAAGVDFDLQPGDVAARGNFCTVDREGNVTDRRAGRIDSETNQRLCEKLVQIKINGVEVFVQTIKEHRFLLVLRGDGLSGALNDTDPQGTGIKPLEPEAQTPDAEQSVSAVKSFVDQAANILSGEDRANMVLLRGFAQKPDWPLFPNVFGLRAAAVAGYPMYRGLARLLGMDILDSATSIKECAEIARNKWNDYDFFFLHIKKTDSAGEDGDFDRKVREIEAVDKDIQAVRDLNPDVLIVTGDHSTPSIMQAHSWHPVPVLLWSKLCRPDGVAEFGERPSLVGGLGASFPTIDIMPLALAHAGRLKKYGA